MRRLLIACLLVSILVVGCQNSGGAGGDAQEQVNAGQGTATGVASEAPSEGPASVGEELSAAGEAGFPGIELLTPTSGGGIRPTLEWASVEGAAHYIVSVRTPEGEGYWAWRTEDTSVPVGGLPRLNEQAAGPSIAEGMKWFVVALDESDSIIAVSNHRPISP
jgi:predicted small secreted protein